ncbi:hypothetical protein RRG08_040376 [Elysia crispata]|uniref:Uncharacterized protein n=1 Tax=Elysia crispata TaxID=231223 RepID=A0AAE1DS45_9GAST|nr:hypothetical protein RRG08_040376 [Elysia crispata]
MVDDAGDEGVVKTFILTPVHPQSGPAANPKHNLHAEESSHFLQQVLYQLLLGKTPMHWAAYRFVTATRVSMRTNGNIRKKNSRDKQRHPDFGVVQAAPQNSAT